MVIHDECWEYLICVTRRSITDIILSFVHLRWISIHSTYIATDIYQIVCRCYIFLHTNELLGRNLSELNISNGYSIDSIRYLRLGKIKIIILCSGRKLLFRLTTYYIRWNCIIVSCYFSCSITSCCISCTYGILKCCHLKINRIIRLNLKYLELVIRTIAIHTGIDNISHCLCRW